VLGHIYEHDRSSRLPYAVNLSRASISDPAWVRELVDLVQTSDVPGARLVFEVSEKWPWKTSTP